MNIYKRDHLFFLRNYFLGVASKTVLCFFFLLLFLIFTFNFDFVLIFFIFLLLSNFLGLRISLVVVFTFFYLYCFSLFSLSEYYPFLSFLVFFFPISDWFLFFITLPAYRFDLLIFACFLGFYLHDKH